MLEEGDWGKAGELLEQALNIELEDAKIYVGKLCAELQIKREEDLLTYELPLENYSSYKRAVQFADKEYIKTLELYNLTPKEQEERKKAEHHTVNLFIEAAENLKNAKEVYDIYISYESYNEQHDELRNKLKEIVESERLYGHSKKQKAINIIKNHFQLE